MTTVVVNGQRRSAPQTALLRRVPYKGRSGPELRRFIRGQTLDIQQATKALRPFRRDEFGSAEASPSPAHIQKTNSFLAALQQSLVKFVKGIEPSAETSTRLPTPQNLQGFLTKKEMAVRGAKELERIWAFYFELFGQRQTRFADWLLGADRIGLDCYQAVYTGLGTSRSIPTPPPFSYMETGFTPATFRRGVVLTRLGRRRNPFPIVKLPYHRLVNPWTLGAVHHEVSHNLQNDLGLWSEVPKRILLNLRRQGVPQAVANVWRRWVKETWADLCGLLLGGPAIVTSLIGVVARSPRSTLRFNPTGAHPTPYLRVLINLELLRRMGFPKEAAAFGQLWQRLYPSPRSSNIPRPILDTFAQANRTVVDTICFQPYRQLGNKSLIEVVHFRPVHQKMVAEAAQRIAGGIDPGIIPARFLVGAARWALSEGLAKPERITRDFYQALVAR